MLISLESSRFADSRFTQFHVICLLEGPKPSNFYLVRSLVSGNKIIVSDLDMNEALRNGK